MLGLRGRSAWLVCVVGSVLVSAACGHGDKDGSFEIPDAEFQTEVPHVDAYALSMSSGYLHACEVRTNHSLWCWGWGNQGQLGTFDINDPVIETAYPVHVGTDYDWAWVEAGLAHNCAAKLDGSLWCWGFNASGELGIGSADAFGLRPEQVEPGTTWKSVSACKACAQAYTMAIASDGTLWTWGTDYGGRMGLDPVTQTSVPMQVGTANTWAQVDAGIDVTLAIQTDGTLWGWGGNSAGHLGDGTTTPQLAPVQIGTDTDWAQVSVAYYRACAIKKGGALYCWGGADGPSPVEQVPGTTFSRVAIGTFHTCAVQTDGTLWCEGNNSIGQLGIGSLDAATELTQVGTDTDWADVITSNDFTCGIKEDGSRFCWGYNWRSQLGTGTPAGKRTPTEVKGSGSFAQIATGWSESTVGLQNDGTLWEWGLRIGAPMAQVPTQTGSATSWNSVTAGQFHFCGTQADDSLWCWGLNSDGELGNNSTTSESNPVQIGTDTWSRVSAGTRHTCGIRTDNTLWCWGDNTDGQIGDATNSDALEPVAIGGVGPWSDVTAGPAHSCAVDSNGNALCWGDNNDGALGTGDFMSSNVPVPVLGTNWRQLSAGSSFTCGTRTDNTLWCWGRNYALQLGIDEQGVTESETPLQVGTDTDWALVDAGGDHACALKTDGSLWCWGDHIEGQAGVGGPLLPLFVAPTPVGSDVDWVSVEAGMLFTCGTKADGSARCFGYNGHGQLGDATTWYTTPQPVW